MTDNECTRCGRESTPRSVPRASGCLCGVDVSARRVAAHSFSKVPTLDARVSSGEKCLISSAFFVRYSLRVIVYCGDS